MKRICLFAGYDPEGIIDPYVIHYLQELSRYADIHYLADCEMNSEQLEKIDAYTVSSKAYKHGKYDFGSWAEIIKNIGWQEIEKYDELILANDSQYLVGDIGSFIHHMENQNFDFWAGLAVCENYVGGRIPMEQFIASRNILETPFTFVSSFLVFSKELFTQEYIHDFFDNIVPVKNRLEVSDKYEIGLSRMLIRRNVNYGVFIEDIYSHSSIYKNSAFHFLTLGYPFIKIKVFFSRYYPVIAPMKRFGFISFHNPNLDIHMLKNHLNRVKNLQNGKEQLIEKPPGETIKKIVKFFLRGIYEISPKFLSRYIKRAMVNFGKLLFEAEFFKSKFDYFSRFISTIPEQRKLGSALRDKKKLIIYFMDARDIINGGMLSINRFAKKSAEIDILSDYHVVISGVPLFNPPVKHSYFKETSPQIKFSRIVKNCQPEELVIHLPEVYPFIFFENLSPEEKEWLVKIPKLQINILDQNNEMMPERNVIRDLLSQLTENITITTAHRSYCTQSLANKYSTPVHQLTPFLPEFPQIEFQNKEKIILISNDNNLFDATKITKADVITKLETNLPDFKIIEIQNFTLQKYKESIAKALFTISFGEGFDGYFMEPILSKSLSFAVFNPFYFPPEFLLSDIVYRSWDELYDNIVDDIQKYSSNKSLYENTQSKNQKLIEKYISDSISRQELINFYSKKYDFVPEQKVFELFENKKQELVNDHNFHFFENSTVEEMVRAPDGNVFFNMRGDFYPKLEEIYLKNLFDFDLHDDFIFLDLGFNGGMVSLYLLKKYRNLKKVYGFDPILPRYEIGLKNINNNQAENKVILKPLGLSDDYYLRKVLFIPDWASGSSVYDPIHLGEMCASSEMKDKIRYVEAEFAPAHSELRKIIENTSCDIVMNINLLGANMEILDNLLAHGLIDPIKLITIRTNKENLATFKNKLENNRTLIEKEIGDDIDDIFRLIAYKK